MATDLSYLHQFKNFSKSWDFKQQTVSPHYHQSNDLVEWSIQTVKQTLKKTKHDQQDEYLALLFLNSQLNFAQTYPQSNPCFHKIQLLLKLQDTIKRTIRYRIFQKEIPLGFVLIKKTKVELS